MAAPDSPSSDDEQAQSGSRSGANLMMVCAAALVIVAVSLAGGRDASADRSHTPAAAPQAAAPAAPASPDARETAAAPHLPRSRPVRLLIPKISVDAPFTDLAIGPSGQLEPPPAHDTNLVGWYADGASPGEAGTAIIAGHVDTTTSAAVFAGLGELRKGDLFHVVRADGRKATFVVDSAETFAKDAFPSDRVYADTSRAEVRLITCAGDYDRTARDYKDNLVVFAHLV
ncbi:class F sortase [Streptomyces griseorubiginosus]|uniref:class F sortase n=1 Tax=Streptomyces griseorubiginosus TaxID=67304 RepID=UPI001AD61F8D|nr:class F sortase [Streptomyces griseorubiginosus]